MVGSSKVIQCPVIRPETRARELMVVARLISYGEEPQRKQMLTVPQWGEEQGVNSAQVTNVRPETT